LGKKWTTKVKRRMFLRMWDHRQLPTRGERRNERGQQGGKKGKPGNEGAMPKKVLTKRGFRAHREGGGIKGKWGQKKG